MVSGSPEWAPARHNSGTTGTNRAQDFRVNRQTFRRRILSNHPTFAAQLERNHQIEHQTIGENYADRHLSALNRALHVGRLNLSTATEEQISHRADGYARRCFLLQEKGEQYQQRFLDKLGIEQKLDDAFRINLCDTRWWHSFLYKRRAEMFAHVYRSLGSVHKSASPYTDPGTVQSYERTKLATRTYLEQTHLHNEQGFSVTLAELADSSISNPRIRRSEMMTQLRGISDWAESKSQDALFVTLTAPSRMHRCSAKGVRNPNYDGSTVRFAQAYLKKVWARIRAQLKRQNIDFFGMRVAEPHQDGCPHWHLLIFSAPAHQSTIQEIMFNHALADSPEENGALEHRIKFQACDKSKGSPIAYMAKYVSKNIDGYGLTTDEEGIEIETANQNIIAWARIHRIRQFQFFGCPPRGVWRELRALKEPCKNQTLEAVRQCADRGDFAGYIELMGGTNHHDKPVFCVHLPKNLDISTSELVGGSPSEVLRRYLQCGTTLVPTQLHVWQKEAPADSLSQLERYSYSHAVRLAGERLAQGQTALSWTRDNNCTQPTSNTLMEDKPELHPPEIIP